MDPRIHSLIGRACAAACLFLSLALATQAANERGVWTLWQTGTNNPGDHAAIIAACDAFVKANQGDPFIAVAQTISAWHLLKTGRTDEARSIFSEWMRGSGDPVHAAARELARAWLTRLDMEDVKRALKMYYRMEVRYPDALAQIATHPRIPASDRPPESDRWGRKWAYKTLEFKSISGFRGQKYSIESPMLGDLSELDKALAVPYADLIRLEAARVMGGAGGGSPLVQFLRTGADAKSDAAVVIQRGSIVEGVFLAYVGERLVIVCDRQHWRVMPIPR